MSSIDERVVRMTFQNGQFQKGVADTQKSLQDLKKGLDFKDSKQSLQDLNTAGSKFSLSGMAAGVETIASKLSTLGIIGVTALTNIANRAVDTGIQLAKSLTIQPITDGFAEYELKMGSIQTILANTARHGTTLDQVTASLEELNDYADKTIYNFGDMTKNIGLFTNAGIGIEVATSMIQGFSNVAAASGTSSQGAASAAYQLSQALSAGTIRLMDWRSLTNVGMGNKNMQDGLIEIAEAMGTINAAGTSATDIQSDFNGSLEKGWLSADVMSSYLQIMAGTMTEAEQAALGLSDAQIKAFSESQATAEDAATKVRTWTQLVGTLQESVGSSWAQTFEILLGDFDQATELFTAVSDTLGGMIGQSGDARNELLQGWSDLGGRTVIIEALGNAFDALLSIMKPIGDAFTRIFPPATAQQLYDISVAIRDFTEGLILSEESSNALQRTFQGLFAIFGIGWEIIKQVVRVLFDLFGTATEGAGGVLELTGSFGDFLVSVYDAIKGGTALTNIFNAIATVLKIPIAALGLLATALEAAFSGGGIGQAISGRIEQFGALGGAINEVISILFSGDFTGSGPWSEDSPIVNGLFVIREAFQAVGEVAATVINALFKGDYDGGAFSEDSPIIAGLLAIHDAVSNLFSAGDFSGILDLINTGLLGGIALLIKKFIDGLGDFDLTGGFSGILDGLTGSLEAMQANLKAGTLMKIAMAIGILAASVLVLSLIDPGRLASALSAMAVMFLQLSGALLLLEKAVAGKGLMKLPVIAASLILLGIALLAMSAAVAILATMNWNELAKGLSAFTIILGVLAGYSNLVSTNAKGMITSSLAFILLGSALLIFANAVAAFAALDWGELAKGISALTAVLGVITAFSKLTANTKGIFATSVALIAFSTAMLIMASAIGKMGALPINTIVKGLGAIAGGLLIVAGAMNLMPKGMAVQALGLIGVSAALLLMAKAITTMGSMSWDKVAKGLVTLAGGLAIIAGGLYLMTGTLAGSAALLVAALALMALVPVLTTLGGMSWEAIITGLVALAGIFAVIGLAGLALTPVVPTLLLLGVAIGLIGVAVLAAGAGLAMFAAGLTALSVAGAAGTAALVALVTGIAGLIPMLMEQLGAGIIAMATVIGEGAPALIGAFVAILQALIEAVVIVVPQIVQLILDLILQILNALVSAVPQMVDAGLQLLTGILNGIANNIASVVAAALNVVAEFINGISQGLPGIIDAGFNLIITFVESLANTVRQNSARMGEAGADLAMALIEGMVNGIGAGVGRIVEAAKNMAANAWNAAMDFLGVNSPSKLFHEIGEWTALGFSGGIDDTSDKGADAATRMGEKTMDAMSSSISKLSDMVSDTMDVDPTIRPVLDLSDIQAKSGSIASMLPDPSLDISATTNRAKAVFDDRKLDEELRDLLSSDSDKTPSKTEINYTQYNTSPKALSQAEIYRNTKNQLASLKGELEIAI